jgi:biopolymer transport protein ExbB/TolQ
MEIAPTEMQQELRPTDNQSRKTLMDKAGSLYHAIVRSPLLWGTLATVAFFGMIHGGAIDDPLVLRYFTSHPVEYMETALFAVGLAALLLKILDVAGQSAALRQSPLGAAPQDASTPEECAVLLDRLKRLSWQRQQEYYARRLRAAVEHVHARGSAEALDDELKFLADADTGRLHASYSLFRVIVWAIPILGFLGTVIGITVALNGVDLDAPDKSMVNVLTGLGLKFDTTALALTLSMVLMFVHFFVERAESALLERVDRHVEEDLAGRFPRISAGPDGQVVAVRRMAETMIQAAERLVQRQAELWQASMDAAAARWAKMTDASAEQLKRTLAAALGESLQTHAQQLGAVEQAAAQQTRQHWERLQQTQSQTVQQMAAIQTGLSRQAEILQRALEATGEVARLEDTLNRNLAALSGAKHFEQTVNSLAATIHLLNGRLSDAPADVAPIRLESTRRKSQAA